MEIKNQKDECWKLFLYFWLEVAKFIKVKTKTRKSMLSSLGFIRCTYLFCPSCSWFFNLITVFSIVSNTLSILTIVCRSNETSVLGALIDGIFTIYDTRVIFLKLYGFQYGKVQQFKDASRIQQRGGFCEGSWITSSGTIGEAHSGKLLATPSHAQQCWGRPSGPNIVFLKTCNKSEVTSKLHFQSNCSK